MPAEFHFDAGMIGGFVAALARVSGVVLFLPLPGVRSATDASRIVLSVLLTVAVAPAWPVAPAGGWTAASLLMTLLGDAAFGAGTGLVISFLIEIFLVAAQAIGLQAGFSFASTVDPNSQADSSVLLVLMQLVAGLLLFASGLHHEAIRAIARSFSAWPPGGFSASGDLALYVVGLGGAMLSFGVRMALPVVALLIFADVAMALMGRIHAQLQLMTLAFPVKILASLLLIAATATVAPSIFERAARQTGTALVRLSVAK